MDAVPISSLEGSDWRSSFAALDCVPGGVMVLRRDLRVAHWNRCLEHWTDVSRDRMVGSLLTDRYPHLGEAKYLARFRAVFNGGPPTVFSSQLHGQLIPSRLRNGEPRVQHTTVTAIKHEDSCSPGHPAEHMALFDIRDVTDHAMQVRAYREACERAMAEVERREAVEGRLAEVNTRLVDKNKEIEAFAHTCSHDLKSPLWTVKGYCKLLLGRTESFADRDARDCVQYILSGVDRMTKMVDGLLGYALASNAERRFEPVDMGQLVVMVLEDLSNIIKQSDAEVQIIGESPVLSVDRIGIQHILTNLLNNAIKFRDPERTMCVQLGMELVKGVWEVWVRDNGIGIPPKFHQSIFEPFKRLHSVKEYEGSGIGLAACRRAVERHGGTIWVVSTVGKGAEFRFTLPRANAEATDSAQESQRVGDDSADAA